VLILATLESVDAADFSCSSGNVTCLIASINDANGMPGEHVINLEPGIYTVQAEDNATDGANGLPSISRSIRIQASADDPPTVIERDPAAPFFRIFHVSVGGELVLDGLTVQRGDGFSGATIFNRGVTSLRDSIVTDSSGIEKGAVRNIGILNVIRSIIADNSAPFLGGGIFNEPGGNVLVENSTIAHNGSQGGGGIWNEDSIVIRNSAIIGNGTGSAEPGGGILNGGGSVEIVNSTIAKNIAGLGVGGGVYNCCGGTVSITNSTIRENQASGEGPSTFGPGGGGGIKNESEPFLGVGGPIRVLNTIIAGNTITVNFPFASGPECFGTIASLGNNLAGDPADCDINFQPSDLTGDLGLGSLVGTGEDDLPGKAFLSGLGWECSHKQRKSRCLSGD